MFLIDRRDSFLVDPRICFHPVTIAIGDDIEALGIRHQIEYSSRAIPPNVGLVILWNVTEVRNEPIDYPSRVEQIRVVVAKPSQCNAVRHDKLDSASIMLILRS